MIGTLFRFLILRVLGGRAAAVLAIIGVILGWRNRRADGRIDREDDRFERTGDLSRTGARFDRTGDTGYRRARFDRTGERVADTQPGRTPVPPRGSTSTEA